MAQFQAISAEVKQEMPPLKGPLPEYPIIMKMFEGGPTLGPQFKDDIDDALWLHFKKALVSFVGITVHLTNPVRWMSVTTTSPSKDLLLCVEHISSIISFCLQQSPMVSLFIDS